jgi:hypothetical protein
VSVDPRAPKVGDIYIDPLGVRWRVIGLLDSNPNVAIAVHGTSTVKFVWRSRHGEETWFKRVTE